MAVRGERCVDPVYTEEINMNLYCPWQLHNWKCICPFYVDKKWWKRKHICEHYFLINGTDYMFRLCENPKLISLGAWPRLKPLTKMGLYSPPTHHKLLIGPKGDILVVSPTFTASEPKRTSPSWSNKSLGDILAGSLTLTANEPARISPSLYDYISQHQ